MEGATWRQDLVLTMNSGFGLGSRRIGEHGGDKEGRERGGFLPRIRGVGRTGRGPIAVPASMIRALLGGKSADDNARLDTVQEENDSAAAAEEERRVAAVEEKRVLREAIKNEVEKSCEIPYRDERSLYRLAAEDGSDESITAMAEQILQKLAEAQQFVGEKQRKADSTVDEKEWYRTLNVESTQETRYINEILNFDEYYPRLEAAEVRLRRFCLDIKGELMSKRVIGFRETRCCIKEPLPGYAFRGLGSHLDNSHALQPVERELCLKQKLEGLCIVAPAIRGGIHALTTCIATLCRVAGRRCDKCWWECAAGEHGCHSRAYFIIFRDFWNEDREENYTIRREALERLEMELMAGSL